MKEPEAREILQSPLRAYDPATGERMAYIRRDGYIWYVVKTQQIPTLFKQRWNLDEEDKGE